MKKSLLIIFLFIIYSFPLIGKGYVGGALSTSKIGGDRSINIIPEIGYCINTHNSISLSLAYSTFIDSETNNAFHSLRVTPCYSYIIPIDEKWQIDINTSFGYSRFFRTNANRVGLYLGPQLEYYIKPQWSVWFSFDAISLEADWYDKDTKAINVNFNWFNNGINFGFYYYF